MRRCVHCGRMDGVFPLFNYRGYWFCEECLLHEFEPRAAKCECCGNTAVTNPIYFNSEEDLWECDECVLKRCKRSDAE